MIDFPDIFDDARKVAVQYLYGLGGRSIDQLASDAEKCDVRRQEVISGKKQGPHCPSYVHCYITARQSSTAGHFPFPVCPVTILNELRNLTEHAKNIKLPHSSAVGATR